MKDPVIQYKMLIIGGALIFSLLVIFIIIFIFLYQRRYYRYKQERIQLQSQFQETLLQSQLEIQEQTLKTISQEVHDNIGQVLSLAKLNLSTMDIARQDELQEKIVDSKKLVSKAIQDLRDLSKSMNTDNIEAIGLLGTLQYEMEMVRKTGFLAQLNVEGIVIRLQPQKELIVFRIIQEILNNIMKHAEATSIDTRLIYNEKEVKIIITDNGKGFDLEPLNKNTTSGFGLGIRNMHNRAKLIGADFTMNSIIGKGTVVVVAIPLNNQNA